jgi:hypothetical protein
MKSAPDSSAPHTAKVAFLVFLQNNIGECQPTLNSVSEFGVWSDNPEMAILKLVDRFPYLAKLGLGTKRIVDTLFVYGIVRFGEGSLHVFVSGRWLRQINTTSDQQGS